MMIVTPKNEVLRATMVSVRHLEEVQEMLGDKARHLSWNTTGDVSVRFRSGYSDVQEAENGDIIIQCVDGECFALKENIFKKLFDYHFIPDAANGTFGTNSTVNKEKKEA